MLIATYPKSKQLFNGVLQLRIVHTCARWTIGWVPSFVTIDHWKAGATIIVPNISSDNISAIQQKYQLAIDMKKDIVSTHVKREIMVFGHCEFVQQYLQMSTYKCPDTTLKFTLTFESQNDDPIDGQFFIASFERFHTYSVNTLITKKLNPMANYWKEQEEKVNKLEEELANCRKEYQKILRLESEQLSSYEQTVDDELEQSQKEKRDMVKQILQSMQPGEAMSMESDEYF
ncbi:hypothetical protein RFI_29351 [Reticulomyxa filosa]|uniref:Uncharacterized protein n=1 Tax=Reticulomyxa filosa TaxID=46433 RepID=X6M4S3_RETFI|nr:hypothetical protein RFI_29351 [Reticulomyxa filosa]|eukprot:ETO08040.1 hypothetical protein RFI_29351 [Reticulomyxa filosa]